MGVQSLKLVSYVRVSTDAQAEDGYGLDVQRQAVDRWAKANGYRITKRCSDKGVSGTLDALDRDGLACVLESIETKQVAGVVVAKLDRLARRLHVQEAVLAHVWRLGGRAFAADTGEILQDDPDDPMRTAIRQIVGVFAELERSMIVKRMRDGRKIKAQDGGYAGYGSPAYGFRADKRELVPDESEQATLARIRDLHEGGASLRKIAVALTAEGHRPKRSSTWHPETLRRIVARIEDG